MVAPYPHGPPWGHVVTGAREEVLAWVRAALRDRPGRAPEIPRSYRRSGEYEPGATELLDLLADRLVDYRATVHRTNPQSLPDTIADALASSVPQGRIVVPAGLPDGWAPEGATVDDGRLSAAELDDMNAVLTGCAAAAAETGTIVLDGSANQGRRAITLVPDRHICVVYATQVVQTVPELLARLDPRRPLTFISGPSATSDIELQRVEGVHGPRTLVVILVRD
jgi:L-lactate dehydrogenase complex protein LldG